MQLLTNRFGTIEVDSESVITLTQPIIGFQQYRRFVLLPGPESNKSLKWLQSTDSGELAFLVMDPRAVLANYEVELSSHDLMELAADSLDELEVYTLVVVPPDPTQVRTNLKAPIIINTKRRLGKQAVLDRSDYPIQYFLARSRQASDAPQEVVHARSDS